MNPIRSNVRQIYASIMANLCDKAHWHQAMPDDLGPGKFPQRPLAHFILKDPPALSTQGQASIFLCLPPEMNLFRVFQLYIWFRPSENATRHGQRCQ
jgi:hypothetical protein